MQALASRSRRAACVLFVVVLVLVLAASAPPLAHAQQKVYACPQPDGPVRYQDRPCAATPPAPAAPKAEASGARVAVTARAAGRDGDAAPRGNGTAPPPTVPVTPAGTFEPPTVGALPESRAEYLARNARRCDAGDRRACVAVTCERSGGLGTKSCQAALGYRRGAGWDLRPATDVFDPRRREDEYALRCTQQSRRARVVAAREGGDARVYAGEGEPTSVPLESIAQFAERYCAAK